MAKDYNQTLNLPETEFPMRASLPQREPAWLDGWNKSDLYHKMMEKNEGKPLYVLHDGPPYANGDIHLGTALNKILKDIIIKNKNMSGFKSPFIPGWDTHGLPIELKAMKKVGVSSNIEPVELRKHCKEFALHYMGVQREQFKRLGVLADFDNPYLTLKPEFEAKQIEVFGTMANKGYIYKGLKPVYWCPECHTALAEAEIEYAEDPCFSIYVKFPIKDDQGKLSALGLDMSKTFVVIWTTTTWTLPGNMAICLGPEYEYTVVKANGENYVMAAELVPATMKAAGIAEYETVGSFTGKDLELMVCRHPFMDKDSLVIVGDHVTLESGTGCVHTAPGHGVEDFEVCVNHYPQIEIVVPVDSEGKLTSYAGEFAGLTTENASKTIAKHLEETGMLFAMEKIIHQYPHCWRCKEPIIFRATEQWFCSVDGFKDKAIKAIEGVEWIPGWGEERIKNMVRDRSDWCISRQRTWGVPIPIFYCKECGEPHIDEASIQSVADIFRKEGSDAWFIHSAEELLPADAACHKCGGKEFTKENDIMDVWFDSGTSHAAVLMDNPDLKWPCDLYLEGADQYRGWFQSSLLTAVACTGQSPYKSVCSVGWVVDGEGRKMSKSLKNGTAPEKVIEQYGADILRLWVASSDYHSDIRVSENILKQLSESYRKIRNTARYILGNISDFNPDTDCVSYDQLTQLDKWAMIRLNELKAKANDAYNKFDFHIVYHSIHNFCTVDMSSFYLDILKDRLYCEKKDGVLRRSAQTVMYHVLRDITLMLAPILSYTAEEIWSFMPKCSKDNQESVFLNDIPTAEEMSADTSFMEKWNRIHAIRDDVNKVLETARKEKIIGKSLEAKVILGAEGDLYDFLNTHLHELEPIFIVSQVELTKEPQPNAGEVEGLTVRVEHAEGEKCERCWSFDASVGSHANHPTLCKRCAEVME